MPVETDPIDNADDSAAYRWGIRALYAAALGMNIYVYWRMSKDDAELAEIRARVEALVRRVTGPLRTKREWRKAVGRMHWQALEIVEESDARP